MTEDVYELPYTARLVIGHLLDDTDVTELVGTAVVTDISEGQYPCVRVTQFGGRIIEGASLNWLAEDLLQLDCFGGGRFMAHDIALKCQRSLRTMRGDVSYTIGSSTAEAVVTGVECGGITDGSDDTFSPAKPYSRFDVTVTAHPLPGS